MSLDVTKLNMGDLLPEIKFDEITQVQLIKYAGAAGDFSYNFV